MYKIAFPHDLPQTTSSKDWLAEKGYELLIGSEDISDKSIKKLISEADAIVVRGSSIFSSDVLSSSPNLKIISRLGVGIDNIDVEYCKNHNIYITVTPHANSLSVAEHAITLMLSCVRQIKPLGNAMSKETWNLRDQVQTFTLSGKTLGLIGLGRIGQTTAEIAKKGFGMNIIGYDPIKPSEECLETVTLVKTMEEVFERSDIISLHLPLSKSTHKIINANLIGRMKKTAYIINTARGGVVDENALSIAIQSGKIAGAGLDVLSSEPPLADNPLLNLENVILTPHSAALTQDAIELMGMHSAMNIHAVLSGNDPIWPFYTPDKDAR